MTKKKERLRPLRSGNSVRDIVDNSQLLEELNHGELLVYMRLVARSVPRERFAVRNVDLHRDIRTAQRALVALEKLRLVELLYAEGNRSERTVVVL